MRRHGLNLKGLGGAKEDVARWTGVSYTEGGLVSLAPSVAATALAGAVLAAGFAVLAAKNEPDEKIGLWTIVKSGSLGALLGTLVGSGLRASGVRASQQTQI